MVDVILNPDESSGNFNLSGQVREAHSAGFITTMAMKLTGIQDEKTANRALVVLAVCLFIISAIILWVSF